MALISDRITLIKNEPSLNPLPVALDPNHVPPSLIVSVWSPVKAGNDPTDPANWLPNHLPKIGDDVYMPGAIMQLRGTTLDGTNLHLGTDGTNAPLPSAVLEMAGGSNLKIDLVDAPNQGNPVRIDAFGKNTIDLTANASNDFVNPTHTSLDINVADDSVLTGRFDISGEISVSINAVGPHSTFDHEGASHLNNTTGIIKIMPDMIGSGITRMTFATMEVGGFVAPTQHFDMVVGSEVRIDHADKFKGVFDFNEGNPSAIVLKDFTINADLLVGNQFSATSTNGKSASFTINYNPQNAVISVSDAPDGTAIISSNAI